MERHQEMSSDEMNFSDEGFTPTVSICYYEAKPDLWLCNISLLLVALSSTAAYKQHPEIGHFHAMLGLDSADTPPI
ncbi:hypothetical protein BTVI_96814 [Pitangus sulphuratus]|nr:hypothetical protein BTVI_96814 [Pitangus sulphuratus]